MARRIITRFDIVRIEDGKFEVIHRAPQAGGQMLEMIGPEPVKPPGRLLTNLEINEWVKTLGPIYKSRFRIPSPAGLAATDEETPLDERIAGLKVETRLEQNEGVLLVEMRNVGLPLKGLSVWWQLDYETPQPSVLPGPGKDKAIGRKLFSEPGFDGTLDSGKEARFFLQITPAILNEIAAHSSERYYLQIKSGDDEFARVDGGLAGSVVESADG